MEHYLFEKGVYFPDNSEKLPEPGWDYLAINQPCFPTDQGYSEVKF